MLSESEGNVHVEIDRERCQGHARCAEICPAVFDLDDEGFVVLRSAGSAVHDDSLEAVRLAEGNCPEGVIRVVAGGRE